MTKKYEFISQTYNDICKEVISSPKKWQEFLLSASYNYKLRFDEQLLVYSQRPDATAVLEIEKWNKVFGRWVNRGAKGIAVFADTDGETQKLKHYFDITDTHEGKYSKPITLWKYNENYEDTVIETLESSFGTLDRKDNIFDAVISASKNATEDNIQDYLSDLNLVVENSFLEDLTIDAIEHIFRDTVKNSVSFVILSRLGIDAREYFEREDFENIVNFNTKATLNSIGYATSDIVQIELSEISKTIISLDKENRIIDEKKQDIYTKDEINTERSLENETDNLHSSGGLSSAKFDFETSRENDAWQIRQSSQTISQRETQNTILRPFNEQQAGSILERERRNSTATGTRIDEQNGEERRFERETKGSRYDDLGTINEQSKEQSSRDSEKRSDLSNLDEKLNNENSQYQNPQQPNSPSQINLFDFVENDLPNEQHVEDAQVSLFPKLEISQQIIDETICIGANNKNSNVEICAYMKKDKGVKDNAEFLKNHYGTNGTGFIFEGEKISVWYNENGMRIARGTSTSIGSVTHLSWEDVAKRTRELLDLGRYMPQFKLDIVDEFERQKLSKDILFMVRDIDNENEHSKELLPTFQNSYKSFDEESESISQYLENPDKLSIVIDEMIDFISAWENDNSVLRFQNLYKPKELLERLKDLQREPVQFVSQNGFNPTITQFITDDEIDNVLRGSKNNKEYRLEAQSVFSNTLDKKEREQWLKNHFGTSGSYDGNSNIDYSPSNGMNFSHGNIMEPYAKVNLSWSEIENRVYKMISIGKFLYESDTNVIEFEQKEPNDDLIIGTEIAIDDGNFVIEEINNGYVSMRDISFEENAGVPVFRRETVDFVKKHLLPEKETQIEQVITKEKIESFNLHSEFPNEERYNFNFADNEVEVVGPKERFRRNMDAIKVLKECEFENRFATPNEQVILSKYVGWGGLSEAFDEKNSSWSNEFQELYTTLSPNEYANARESTLTAFYTPATVVKAIYKIMEQLGFKNGNILEPSCGIGNFIGMIPKSMQDSKVYGVELDSLSAGIAAQLYQKSSITNAPYEETNLQDSFFDIVVGNVPFGDFKVVDKKYDKYNFLIHDYFFGKSLDKLRAGGVMALITSKGTMDKENSSVRKYIAQRADLLGAIRLPNDTFKDNAGTQVTSDILILQKRDRLIDIDTDWLHLDTTEDGVRINKYFVDHPDMVLGDMVMQSGRFGLETTCKPYENSNIEDLLDETISNIHGQITDYIVDDELEDDDNSIPADPKVRNFSFTIVDGKVYFRENSRMTPVKVSVTAENRIKGMIEIRDTVRRLIEFQTDNYLDEDIKTEQDKLNNLYDKFTSKYGLINSRANTSAFSDDSSYFLLSALEILDENGKLDHKADMFYKRTIKPHVPVLSVDTSTEALALSMGEKAKVDIEYMSQLTGKTENELYSDLTGVMFLNPLYNEETITEEKYLMADEYLSGNVRYKLNVARNIAKGDERFNVNVQALEKVQPKDLTASEIDVRLGATWIPTTDVCEFIFHLLETSFYLRSYIKVHYTSYTGEWNVEGKNVDARNVNANSTYGTTRINAYKIIEQTLNLKDVRIFDYIEEDGKRKPVLNKKETAIATMKQDEIKRKFKEWVWDDPERRDRLCTLYNQKFNSIRPREYDGSHINFVGMNPEISLRPHQKNAVAHILYGGNTLLAHAVGAGKTFEMVAAAQESKRLGLCSKSLFVVPNHLTEQWATEYLQLYPSANILVATKKDFETKNRKRFCGRIATGDYDAIIIGHSQFEKIPMSIDRQRQILEEELDDILKGIVQLKSERAENFSVKQLEKAKKGVENKLKKLNDQSRKDDVVTFEELGVDRIFVDESHYYKNLFLYTKMRNVGGIAQTEAQKSSDLFMKCRYLDEVTGGRGTVFATGTTISNSMVELYTIQRYLQYETLRKNDLEHFDSWASTFGETVTAIELTPEGTSYRAKTRFAKFYNLPELMSMFKEVADIQTADMLKLPVPKANYENIAVKPSDMQKEMVERLSERAENVRSGSVDSTVDNMLKITSDGRKLALDQRMLNPLLDDFAGSKVNACVDNVYRIWNETAEDKSTQLVFCDLSTPKSDDTFSVYNDIRAKLIDMGIPKEDIKFIHDADTESKKKELFKKVNNGDVRILLGSTQKMGAGTNVQKKLVAIHDLDCPWRPSDLEQRAGRIVRQGNENEKVFIYRYVTEQTFDAYLYQLVEGKQKFASQIMTSKSPVRSANDIDETALSYAEIKMLATGNPYIKEKMDCDIQLQKLEIQKANHTSQKYRLEDKIYKEFPLNISQLEGKTKGLEIDIETSKANPKTINDEFAGVEINGVFYTEKGDAGASIIDICKSLNNSTQAYKIGKYRGFNLEVSYEPFSHQFKFGVKGAITHYGTLGADSIGNITRIDNVIDGLEKELKTTNAQLEDSQKQLEIAKEQVTKPFEKEEELQKVKTRLSELNALLNVDKTENEIVNDDNKITDDSNQQTEIDRKSR